MTSIDSKTPHTGGIHTRMNGCPMVNQKDSLTAGSSGPVLLQDIDLIEKMQRFAREKIPARRVHPLGTGAYGTLTITNDITKYSKAKVFIPGTKTKCFARLSGTFTEEGDPDTVRDIRGFAMKFYTPDGNWDLMTINTPVFNCRDMKTGPDAVHSQKRDPRTNCWNPTQSWDFISTHPESLHQVLMLYTDRVGTPLSFRMMHTWGCNTYSFINEKSERFWVKFHVVAELGCKGMTKEQAKLMAGEDPEWLQRDFREAILQKRFPRWKLAVQVMDEASGYANPMLAFDCTKVWSHEEFPLIDIGVIELNTFPTDYHAEVEQVAFSPARIVPGIGFSPDKLLQGRLFIYDDTQYHRLGPNFQQLPINCPVVGNAIHSIGSFSNQEIKQTTFPHYAGGNLGGPAQIQQNYDKPFMTNGPANYYNMPGEGTDADYYDQPRTFYNKSLTTEERLLTCDNIAASLEKVHEPVVVAAVLGHLEKIDPHLFNTVKGLLQKRKDGLAPKTEGEMMWATMSQEMGLPLTSKLGTILKPVMIPGTSGAATAPTLVSGATASK